MIVKTCRKIADDRRFQNFIMGVIVWNALVMGLETSRSLTENYRPLFHLMEVLVQGIFVAEIAIRLVAFWPRLGAFFRDGWNLFDFTVVALSLLPAAGPFAAVARLARVLRVVRLVSHSSELRLIVGTMLRSIPSMGHVTALMGILMYVYGVLGWHLYHAVDPGRWGTLPKAFMTLFQLLTLDDWIAIQGAVVDERPLAWLYFTSFIVVAVFVVVNLFIAVVLNNLQNVQEELKKGSRKRSKDQKDP